MTRGVHNAPAQTSQVAMTAATECRFEVLPHPPYSPDMAPSDSVYLFPKLKSNLRGTQFGSNEGVIAAVNEYLEDQDKDFYLEGISMLKQSISTTLLKVIISLTPSCQILRVTDETLIVETAVWPIPSLINVFTALK